MRDLVPQDRAMRLDPRRELCHQPGETVFGRLGPVLRDKGWSCFPQMNSERRKPSVVDRVTLKWKPFQHRLPTEAEMRSWSLQCPDENVAVITGAVSSDLFALDVDVNDFDLAWAVREAANEHMGVTPFLRFGRVPRVVMLYRHQPDSRMRKRSFQFGHYREDGTWAASGDAIEFLANGSPFTAYGTHHKTGEYFKWTGVQPFLNPPTDAPLVTPGQIEAFLAAVQEIRRFASSRTGSAEGGDTAAELPEGYEVTEHGYAVPDMARNDGWTVEDGHVVDGRERYLYRLVGRTVAANPEVFDDLDDADEARQAVKAEGRRILRGWAVDHVTRCVREGGARSRQAMHEELRGKFDRAIEAFNTLVDRKDGKGKERRLKARPTYKGTDGKRYSHGTLSRRYERDAALSWLGERKLAAVDAVVADDDKAPRVRTFGSTPATDEAREARRLGGDRKPMQARVKANNVTAEDDFLADWRAVPMPAEEDEAPGAMPPARTILNAGPTGAGKTTGVMGRLYEEITAEKAAGLPYRGPTMVLQPSNANISESVATGTGIGMHFHAWTDDDAKGTVDHGGVGLQALVDEAVALGVHAVHLKSKLNAGCFKADQIRALQEASWSTSGLCRAERLDQYGRKVRGPDGKPVVDVCEHYDAGPRQCGFRRMIAALETADVVFAAHAHLTGPLPSVLKEVRARIVDESVMHQILATGQIAMSTLEERRPYPDLTAQEFEKLEKEHGKGKVMTHHRHSALEALMAQREVAVDLLAKAHAERIDPVVLFADTEGALAWAETAKRICAAAMAGGRRITPTLTLRGVREELKKARPKDIEIERRLWDALATSTFALLQERREGRVREVEDQTLPRDARLQPRTDKVGKEAVRVWRVSWRRDANWAGVPTLLLDATGDEVVTRHLFPKAEVVVHKPVDCDPNLRVVLIADRAYSPSSLYPDPDATVAKRKAAETIVSEVRQLSSMVAGVHGDGQVLWVAPLRTRRQYWTQNSSLGNLMPAHLGALRGQDWAKSYWASVCVGRSEQPIWVIDGLVAALTWDTAPEHPFDRRGDGLTDKGAPLYRPRMPRRVRVRDGSDEMLSVPMMPTDMGRRVEAMWREAELTQMVGRLRGIYRDVPGTVILCCDCPPEDLLVDDILTMAEALGDHSRAWDVIGEARGIMLPYVTCRTTPIAVQDVQAFVARYRPWHAMREIAWTDVDGVRHEGLAPVWVTDVAATLRDLDAPQRVLDTLVVRPARTCPLTWTAREADHVTVVVEAAWGPNRETHYEVFKVSHPLEEGELEHERVRRFGATYDPADYAGVECCDPEDAPPTAPEVADMTMEPAAC